MGGGFKDIEKSKRPMADVMPEHVDWVKAGVAELDPDQNKIQTADGRTIKYDYLIVATGMQVGVQGTGRDVTVCIPLQVVSLGLKVIAVV